MFLPFKSTAFRRGKFIPRPQCLAFTPLPLGVNGHHMLHKPIQGAILVAVKVYPEIVSHFIIYAFNLFININYFQSLFGSEN